ncbi:DNA topoisomerase IB [uncultured Sulfitobacter sp.]|uniref:DNA topoisomerase IB n=1 Tax=uncultured Sulfitobacter sp. TaxID=191468 RepID=UPI002602AD7B|nr:DNA topoisomerase IB [uncultured Sulfitobacter sp.]
MTSDIVYVTDADPGISRRRRGRGFSYAAPDGTVIARGPIRERIEALAVPPAYEDVWICAQENGHLQATGRDSRNRKQYQYHPDWTAMRSETKFDNLVAFGQRLPAIRRRVLRDLQTDPGDLEFALAAAVDIIDRAALRVGHPEYSEQNGSYGALTLRRRHLSMKDGALMLRFTAKGGQKVRKVVTDRKLHSSLQRVNDVPGARLLSWLDDAGAPQSLSSEQLNGYLAKAAKDDAVTAKTFRTWAGTLAAFAVAEDGPVTIKQMSMAAADRLHNTPTVARNSYIHPAVVDLAGAGSVTCKPQNRSGLRVGEQRLLGFLTAQ